jgi:hypothetical protein
MNIEVVLVLFAAAWPALAATIDRSAAIALAIETASRELHLPAPTIKVTSAERAQWRDSGLGCTPKGTASRPQLTDGYKVTLRYDDGQAVVHVTDARAVVCSHTESTKASSKPLAVTAAKMIELARTDLAARLKVAPREISADVARPTTWPDESLGCPVAGKIYSEKLVPGFTIDFTHDKKRYRYHSDMNARVVWCDEAARQ